MYENLAVKVLLSVSMPAKPAGFKASKEVIPYNVKTFDGKEVSGSRIHWKRQEGVCTKKTKINLGSYKHFISDECPHWEKEFNWKKMGKQKRLESHLNRMSDGFPFTYEMVTD